MTKLEEIQKLKSLFDQGAITQEEFDSIKKNIISAGVEAKESISLRNANATYEENVFAGNAGDSTKIEYPSTTNKTNNKKPYYRSISTGREGNNGVTKFLLFICVSLSIVAGAYFGGDKYKSFIIFLIIAGFSIAVAYTIPKLTPKRLNRNLLLGLQAIVLILINIEAFENPIPFSPSYESGSSSGSSSSYSSGSRTCSWCGKSYTGNGYMHFGTGCVEGDKNLGSGNMCSTRCCQEEWLTDSNNPNNSRR